MNNYLSKGFYIIEKESKQKNMIPNDMSFNILLGIGIPEMS